MEIIVVGCQSGDEGKGKFTDFFSEQADIVVRFQAGPNTGHTVVGAEGTFRYIQLPVGLHRGKQGVLGNGCVIEPQGLLKELAELSIAPKPEHLLISERAHVVMPYHPLQEIGMERWRGDKPATSASSGFSTGSGQLGSTNKGVGACREDKIARIGLRMVDLLDYQLLCDKLNRIIPLKKALIEQVYGITFPSDLQATPLANELFECGQKLKECITDVSSFLAQARKDHKSIVHEGAQSVGLDIEHGTYPYCSSGNSASPGVFIGTGSPPNTPFTVVGVAKAYMVQVGGGPLPTELNGKLADYLVDRGNEIGTVTGRRRRVGWFDMNFVRNAIRINGATHLCITNIDVLAGLEEVQLATHYLVDGQKRFTYPTSLSEAANAIPVLRSFPGWDNVEWDLVAERGYEALPPNSRSYIEWIVDTLDVSLAAVSVGPDRSQTIMIDDPTQEEALYESQAVNLLA